MGRFDPRQNSIHLVPLKWWRHFWPAPYLKHWHNSRRLIISYRKCSLKIWNDMILVSDLEGWTDLIWSIELKWYLVTCPSCEERTTSEVGTAEPPLKTKAKMLKVTASIVSQTRDPCRRWSLKAITRHWSCVLDVLCCQFVFCVQVYDYRGTCVFPNGISKLTWLFSLWPGLIV